MVMIIEKVMQAFELLNECCKYVHTESSGKNDDHVDTEACSGSYRKYWGSY